MIHSVTARKPLIILDGEIKTPPFSATARIEAGVLLAKLQEGMTLSFPHARPMPDIGKGCLELRIKDKSAEWRLFCRVDKDAVLLLHVLSKKTREPPQTVIDLCMARLKAFDARMRE